MKDDFIEVYKKQIPDELCNKLVAILNRYEKDNGAGSAKIHIPDRRDFQLALDWIDNALPDDLFLSQKIHNFLNDGLNKYRHKYMHLLGTKTEVDYVSLRVKLQKTPIGGGYHNWHYENGLGTDATRVFVWTVYLNDLPEGEGETEFLHYGRRIQPTKGDMLLFPAYFMHTHRGNPPITTEKYIATGWWHYAV
jgi:hypothetical protein